MPVDARKGTVQRVKYFLGVKVPEKPLRLSKANYRAHISLFGYIDRLDLLWAKLLSYFA